MDLGCQWCVSVLISCNKWSTLVWDVDGEGGYARVGAKDIRETSVLSPQFCCEPKSTLKNKICVKSIVKSCVNNKRRDGSYSSTKPHIKES